MNRLLFFITLLMVGQACAADATVAEPDAYRLDNYDDSVPDTLQGAKTVSALDIMAMQSQFELLIVDVIPEHRRPDELPEGQHWFPVPHKGLAGALWLPDVGFGSLSGVTDEYFKSHLKQATQGRRDFPLVFYCRADCWMSWNAAKRALTYGYTSVHWFPGGVDDWEFEGQPVEILTPAPGERHATVGQ